MKIFTIDIGNTSTHCALVENGRPSRLADFPTRDFAGAFSFGGLSGECDAVCWCSVVPKVSGAVAAKIGEAGVPSVQLSFENSPIFLSVKNPEQVGQDRIAVAIGAAEFFEPPYIIVDMGTAVTIDVVDSKGAYAGGAIAPGLYAFISYLHENTAQLPLINPEKTDYDIRVGKNTLEAMYIGCVKGFCRLVDGIIADFEREFFNGESSAKKTIFTGGSLRQLPAKWIGSRLLEPSLANIGLARACEKILFKHEK
ncbi:MAG: type III pantothenate kinase [Opitutales bacterium]|nr:type III pantothenate kinase [Opitutales bacterium]